VQRDRSTALVTPTPARLAVQPAFAYLVTSILSDNAARTPAFGPNSVLRLPGDRPAAVKTGTTNDFRDNWTIGYTPELVVGTWVGNSDGSPMRGVSGVAGAGPIWNGIMGAALQDTPAVAFPVPSGVNLIEVCADSGTVPGELCPARRSEVFVEGRGPLGAEHDIHRRVRIFRAGEAEYLAPPECPDALVELREYTVYPAEGRQWAIDHGIPQPPAAVAENCQAPEVAIWQPGDGAVVSDIVDVTGQVRMFDFDRYLVEYGEGDDPLGWGGVAGPIYSPVDGGSLATWDTRALPVGRYTLRVRAWDRSGHEAEARVRVNVEPRVPTTTPTLLPTAVTTPTPTATFVPPATPTPTVEPPTPVPSDTPPLPTETPTPAVTATPEPGATLILRVDSPQPGDEVSGDVLIVGVAAGTAFASYSLEFGLGPSPAEWVTIVQDVTVPVPQSDVLALWSTAELADGTYTVRLLGWRLDGSSETVSVTVLVTNGSVAG
jgi:membrane peptidoglycan carboxypeptidase